MFDLAISENGDLIISGARDLQGCAGSALIEQRIRLRLVIRRGSWVFDRTKTLGSQLHTLFNRTTESGATAIVGFIRQALAPMSDEIEITNIQVEQDELQSFTATIFYTEKIDPGGLIQGVRSVQQVIVQIPNTVLGGGE